MIEVTILTKLLLVRFQVLVLMQSSHTVLPTKVCMFILLTIHKKGKKHQELLSKNNIVYSPCQMSGFVQILSTHTCSLVE